MTRLLVPAPRRPRPEPVVPMINVVFLLLIFFLMTAEIAPPQPFPVAPPVASGDMSEPAPALFVSADGQIAFGAERGSDALAAATRAGPVTLRADAALPATELAGILARLGALGAGSVALVTAGGG
ncbi:ExbD/TolR family protein [Salipiger sp.]|uniref:ExbD/TolR family protein n=1 Tax=Salipiger sp. TaxID=2078585 RepID=UPI003A984565